MEKIIKISISKIAIYLYFASLLYLTFKTFFCEFFIGRGNRLYLIFHSLGGFFLPVFLGLFLLFLFFKKLKINKFFLSFFLLFLLISSFSYLINLNKYPLIVFLLGLITLGRQFFYSLFFSSFNYGEEEIKKLVSFLLFFVLFFSLVGIVEFFSLKIFNYKIPFLFTSSDFAKKSSFFTIPRISTLFEHSNRFSNIELFGFNLLISFFFIKEEKKYFLYLLPVVAVIFFTYSRETLAGLFLTGIVLLILNRSKKILIFLSTSLILFFISIPQGVIEKFSDFFTRLEKGFMGSGFYFRAHAFLTSLKVLRDHLLFGVGVGRFGSPVSKFFPSVVEKKYSLFVGPFRNLVTMDMFFPVLWSEIGLFGFTLLLCFYFYILFTSFINYRYFFKRDKFVSAINLGIFLEIVNILFIGFVSFSVNTVILTILIFGSAGIFLRYSYEKRCEYEA